ncbi:hypothetical protein JCGZ_07055 [Jatropha curcas]|uniref:Peptidase A1 domain-containing protein n=1 Tax=Jatropha curcas TaxID=180498 RepID=A0A067KNU6_JATCU|nr:aspartyl protease family protein At5g10770 [Jatropha curcas]KDP33484.1 hypothetical protein JCGZ_07055 [Jatropha curcas]
MATSFSHSHCYFLCASLLCLFLFFSLEKEAHALQARKISHQLTHTIEVSNLFPSTACKHSTKVAENSATLKVVHRRGSCNHLNQDNANSPNVSEILLEDQSRVDSIHARISKTSGNLEETKATRLPAKIGASLGTSNYIVTIGLGTPKKDLPVVFDTGSDLTWTRCKPQVDTFDPTKSASYANISCRSQLCTSTGGGRSICSSSTCAYGVQYGDGSYSAGFLGQDKLTLGKKDSYDKFYFGCGQDIEGLFGKADGLLGLGRDKLSIVSQTASKYKKLFSYCLPTASSTGYLSFGASQSKSAKFVPLLTTSSDFYYLSLTGITVGGQKLSIPTSVFSTAGTIIDSGTVITRLPPAAYSALRSAFKKKMAKYPVAAPLSILDTCFDFSKTQTITFPKIVLSFSGTTDVEVDKTGTFFATGVDQACLAFAANGDAGDKAILGNTQQRTYEVIYDINGGKIGFSPAGCS